MCSVFLWQNNKPSFCRIRFFEQRYRNHILKQDISIPFLCVFFTLFHYYFAISNKFPTFVPCLVGALQTTHHSLHKTCKRGYSTRLNLENSTKESSLIEFRQVLCPYPIWGHGLSLLYFDSKVFSRTEPDK
mgnify:CR=1 FL=1